MKKITLLFSLIVFAITAFSQEMFYGSNAEAIIHNANVIRTNPESKFPGYIGFNPLRLIPFGNAEKLVTDLIKPSGEFGLQLVNVEQDADGMMQHYRYLQTEGGLPVTGSMWIIHVKNGMIVSMNGQLYSGAINTNNSSLTENNALQYALSFVGASQYKWQIPVEEEFIKKDMNDVNATFYPKGTLTWIPVKTNNTSELRLAYSFDVYAQVPLSRTILAIDANNGSVLWKKDLIENFDVNGTAHTQYSGIKSIRVDSLSPTNFRLREATRGIGLGCQTYNMHTGTNYGTATDFTDTDNDWNNVNANMDEYATDAHYAAEMVYDYYYNSFARNSIDGLGFALKSYVHYDVAYLNAFWDGTRMSYGDGSSGYTPLTSLDIGGHEITHGLTSFTANLNYAYESGALNESFSDVFGETIQGYGTNWNQDWLMSANIGVPFRSFIDPNQYQQPDTYLGTFWATGPGDNGGVHTNSGVQNFWYYLLVNGGTGTNDNNAAYTVNGIGILEASAIAFRTLTVYLTPGSQYADARYYSIQAATDLYGACSNEVIQTTNAWHAVGVGGVFVPVTTASFSAGQVSFCSIPASVQFSNSSVNGGVYTWDFGDGTQSNAVSPLHVYNQFGTFTVRLIADGNSCGIDTSTMINYIIVDSLNPCLVSLPATGTGPVQTGCNGTLYDNGGPTSNYLDNEDVSITIAPPGSSSITLTFNSFSFENNYDYLYIYDGPNQTAPLIGQYTNNQLPGGGTIVTTGGSVTIRQTSDQNVNQSGFEMVWNCTIPTAPPFVAFSVDPATTCNGTVSFNDNSTNGASSWLWNFGDGDTSTQQNPTHIYLNNGNYDVQLTACNNIGCDSLTQYNVVSINRPAAPLTIGASRCDNGPLTLGTTGTGTMYWYSDSTATTQVGMGSTYTTPSLSATTTFYVQEHQTQPGLQVGPVNHSFPGAGGGYYSNQTDRYLIFNCTAPCNLMTVDIDAQNGGNRTIELRDAQNNVLQTLTTYLITGWNTVTLNFSIPVGTNLHLAIGGTANCYRNNAGATFPYNVTGGGPVSITGTNGNAGYYYFFYNWQINSPDCISLIAPVTAVIGTPSASIAPSGTITICDGQSVTLTANSGSQYDWSTGDTTQSIIVTTPGAYAVTVGTSLCFATSDSVHINVLPAPVAGISPTGTINICQGDSIELSSTSSGTYMWSNGATDSTIMVSSTDAYSLIVSNGTCADTADATQVNVIDVLAGFYTISLNLGYTFVDTSHNATSWYWDLGDGTISMNQNPAHTYASPGQFTVTLIVTNGNCTDTATLLIDIIDHINSVTNQWNSQVIPNPNDGSFHLILSGNISGIPAFELNDIIGRQLNVTTSQIGNNEWMFDIEQIPAGIYWLKISSANKSDNIKIIKQ